MVNHIGCAQKLPISVASSNKEFVVNSELACVCFLEAMVKKYGLVSTPAFQNQKHVDLEACRPPKKSKREFTGPSQFGRNVNGQYVYFDC